MIRFLSFVALRDESNFKRQKSVNFKKKQEKNLKKQTGKIWRKLFLKAAAIILVYTASDAVFALDKYPKPDFAVMEEGWEIVEWEYDFTENIPAFYVIAKPKKQNVSTWFTIPWRDAKGVRITSQSISTISMSKKRKSANLFAANLTHLGKDKWHR